jgi:tyrosyl-tRNA synthetase
MKELSFINFARDVGKRIVNYMMAKDSVKKRLSEGEECLYWFTYQLIQGYDFYHLHKEYNNYCCKWGVQTNGGTLLELN